MSMRDIIRKTLFNKTEKIVKASENRPKISYIDDVPNNMVHEIARFYEEYRSEFIKNACIIVTMQSLYGRECKEHTKESVDKVLKKWYGEDVLKFLEVFKITSNADRQAFVEELLEKHEKILFSGLKQ